VQFDHQLICPGVIDSVLAEGCPDDFPDISEGTWLTRCYQFTPLYDSLAFSLYIDYSGGGCSVSGDCDQFCSCAYSLSYTIYHAGICSPLSYTYQNGFVKGWIVGEPLVICFTWLPRCRHKWSIPLAWTEESMFLMSLDSSNHGWVPFPVAPAPLDHGASLDFNLAGQQVGPEYEGFIIRCFEDGTRLKMVRPLSQ
jgi:hypothetical protein